MDAGDVLNSLTAIVCEFQDDVPSVVMCSSTGVQNDLAGSVHEGVGAGVGAVVGVAIGAVGKPAAKFFFIPSEREEKRTFSG